MRSLLERIKEGIERLERTVRGLRSAVAWRSKSAKDAGTVIEATLSAAPTEPVLRVDKAGHQYWGSSDEALYALKYY
uniref:Uncharacterized protein n=1 Tax=Fervidicoccus fontis TaxID=683846 RepID=A0A7J3ZID4_9CREN